MSKFKCFKYYMTSIFYYIKFLKLVIYISFDLQHIKGFNKNAFF